MHHHPMWLTEPGVANIMYFRDDQNRANANRDWVCTCGDCDGLVGVWSCPGFYTNTITVSPGYGDDFTPARSNEHVDVCMSPPPPPTDCGGAPPSHHCGAFAAEYDGEAQMLQESGWSHWANLGLAGCDKETTPRAVCPSLATP